MTDSTRKTLADVGLLFLRLSVGATMLLSHGLPKLQKWDQLSSTFADPIGVGPTVSLALAIGAEVGASIFIMLGLATRLAAIPLAFTMLVAMLVVHADDPWSKKEFAFMYLIPCVTLMLTGGGRFAVDTKLKGKLGALR